MENIEFERDYRLPPSTDTRSQDIFDRTFASGGFLEKFSNAMNAIPKVIVPQDAENYEYLLKQCDAFAQRHHGQIHGTIDYERWDAHIDLFVGLAEFDDEEDMALLKDIGEKAHYFCITPQEGQGFHLYIMINYFTELASEEYIDYLKYQLIDAAPQLSSMLAQPEPSEEDLAVMHLIGELLDRLESEAHLDKAIALRAVVDHIVKESPGDISLTRIAAMLTALLEQFPLGDKAD